MQVSTLKPERIRYGITLCQPKDTSIIRQKKNDDKTIPKNPFSSRKTIR
jgi:adenosine/AMP kinase